MKEYIEREAVLRIIDKYGCGNGSVLGHHSGAIDCAGSEIARIPAADVVEVVRCKDCAYGHKTSGGLILCYFWRRGDSAIPALEPDAYCSYGERKEE